VLLARTLLAIAALSAAALAPAGHAAAHSLEELEAKLHEREQYVDIVSRPAPAFTLQDAEGGPVGLADLRGKVVVLNFIYAECPDVCPLHSEPGKTIRHYESVGLLPGAARDRNRYRLYGEADARVQSFVREERSFGFSLAEISELLSLLNGRECTGHRRRALVKRYQEAIDDRLEALVCIRTALLHLVEHCEGPDRRPDTPPFSTERLLRASNDPD